MPVFSGEGIFAGHATCKLYLQTWAGLTGKNIPIE